MPPRRRPRMRWIRVSSLLYNEAASTYYRICKAETQIYEHQITPCGGRHGAELFRRIQPADYLTRFLQEGYRPDGRRSHEFRQPALNAGSITSADGSALVRLGETTVLCGIRAEVAEPDLLSPSSGFLVPNVELPAMCSSKFRPGPPSDEAQVLSNRIRNIALASRLLSFRSLCIKQGKAVWVLYADITCINYDGNVTDAALLALVVALQNTRIPVASWDEDSERAVALTEETRPLKLASITLASSFGVSEDGTILCDPTSFEEPLCQTRLTIALDGEGRLRHVWQAGPGQKDTNAPATLLMQCIKLARNRYQILKTLL